MYAIRSYYVQVELDVVDRGQRRRQHLVGVEQVVQVGAAEVAAAVAVAAGIDREEIAPVVLVGQADLPPPGEGGGATRVAGRDHAVEHVHAALNALEDILRQSDPHQVTRLVGRQERFGEVDHLLEQLQPLASYNFV